MENENCEVDCAEINALLIGLGIVLTGHRIQAERLASVGAKPELGEIIRTAEEGVEMVEQLLDLLFDFDEANDGNIDDEKIT
jgi:hypothetical protein